MEYSKIVEIIAPCGLNCGKCLACFEGEIRRHSQALADLLGPNFAQYAERFRAFNPVFANYPAFRELLDFIAQGSCRTCTKGQCLFPGCRVRDCVQENGVDFCFQCTAFPCDRSGLPPRLDPVWRQSNELMKEVGVEEYYERVKERPRYP
jgi:hypothetical protein